MRIRVDEDSIEKLITIVKKFEDKLARSHQSWDESRQRETELRSALAKNGELQRELEALKHWKESLEGKELAAKEAELKKLEQDLSKKLKEIEDLAYNKGYVAGYVEITQKLGKQSWLTKNLWTVNKRPCERS